MPLSVLSYSLVIHKLKETQALGFVHVMYIEYNLFTLPNAGLIKNHLSNNKLFRATSFSF